MTIFSSPNLSPHNVHGKAKACAALGNTQLKVYHKLLSNPGMRYQDPGPDYYGSDRNTPETGNRQAEPLVSGLRGGC